MTDKLITCNHCKAEHKLSTLLQERQSRPGLLEVGLLCTCGIWTHSYFTTPALKAQALKNAMLLVEYHANKSIAGWKKYETARDVYKANFDEHNRRWRRKFGMLG